MVLKNNVLWETCTDGDMLGDHRISESTKPGGLSAMST